MAHILPRVNKKGGRPQDCPLGVCGGWWLDAGLDLLVVTAGREEAGGGRRAGLSYQVGALITSRSTTPT